MLAAAGTVGESLEMDVAVVKDNEGATVELLRESFKLVGGEYRCSKLGLPENTLPSKLGRSAPDLG